MNNTKFALAFAAASAWANKNADMPEGRNPETFGADVAKVFNACVKGAVTETEVISGSEPVGANITGEPIDPANVATGPGPVDAPAAASTDPVTAMADGSVVAATESDAAPAAQ